MSKFRKKPADRILAATLSVALTTCFTPVSVFAETEQATTTVQGTDVTLPTATTTESTENESTVVSTDVTVSTTTESSVEFTTTEEIKNETPTNPVVSEYTLSVAEIDEQYRGKIRFWINGQESTTVHIGDEFEMKIELENLDDTRFRLNSVKIGTEDIFSEPVAGKNVHQEKIRFTQEMANASDGNEAKITIEIVQFYLIKFAYNSENGSVEPTQEYTAVDDKDPTAAVGTVFVKNEDEIGFTAIPNEHYRVSEIKIDDISKTYDENDLSVTIEEDELEKNKDHNIEVLFALNSYSLEVADNIQNGAVITSVNPIEYGKDTEITLKPDEGCYIHEILLDGEKLPASKLKDGVFKIEKIDADHKLEVVFSKFADATEKDFSWNHADAIESNDNHYVFSLDSDVVFSTEHNGIQLIGENGNVIVGDDKSQKITIGENTKISAVKLFYQESDYVEASWHEYVFEKPIEINFYEGAAAKLELPKLTGENSVYNSDVVLTLNIDVPNEKYPEIAKIEYWIDGETERHEFDDLSERKIVIKAEDYNRADIKVNVLITDTDGHTTNVSSEPFSINMLVPKVDVSISGSILKGADKGYYSEGRTATIKIYDKSYTFNKDVSAFTIKKDGRELNADEKENIISWQEFGDLLTATILFDEDASYSWSMRYTNKAGLYNEGIATEEGDSIYSFWVDNTSPKAEIKSDFGVWNELLSVLTFNIFDKSSISVSVSGTDECSGVKEIMYFKDTYTTNLKNISEKAKLFATLEQLYYAEEDSPFSPYTGSFSVNPQEKAVIYVRVMDNAGRVTYISSEGMIVDSKKPEVVKLESSNKGKFINNSSVEYTVEVNDLYDENIAFSGIGKVYYIVSKDGRTIYEGTLYEWESGNLLDKWKGKFTLNPYTNPEFNQDGLSVTVYVEDNAENRINTSGKTSINIDKLSVNIEFEDEAYLENRQDAAYYTSRTAKFTFNDRKSSFDQERAEAAIAACISASNVTTTSNDGSATILKEIPEDLFTIIWDKDDPTVATVTFNYCGNYTLQNNDNTVYTNMAGNSVNVIGNPIIFTIDTISPTGSFTTSKGTVWDELLKILTFGIYTKDKYQISVESNDLTSPTIIDYFISNDTNSSALTKEQLDGITEWKRYTNPFELEKADNYVIYVRITDYAGNYTYICSDGHIIDKDAPNVVLTPYDYVKEIGEKHVYNLEHKNGIHVGISVADQEPYAGLKTVEYWVEADGVKTQSDTLFSFTTENPDYRALRNTFETTITVDPNINNSSNVVLYVKAVDNADNEFLQSVGMDIDITAPTIEISYDNDSDNGGNTYFDATRTATIVITERQNHFDSKKATDGIVITAVDVDGEVVDNAYTISNWATISGETPDKDRHIATITYYKDANYTFDIAYTDEAENVNTPVSTGRSTSPFKFTVDTTSPTGSITALSAEGRELTWTDLIGNLNFGFWSNANIHISGTSDDRTSPIASIDYYKVSSSNAVDATVALTKGELNAVTTWKSFDALDITPNEQFTVYLRIVDMAGNTTYISTNGLIVDNNAPHEEFTAPEINITPEQSESGIYSGDVKIAISVDDPMVGGTYSGLKTIKYRVLNMGVETQSGTLYEFQAENPLQSELLKSWSGDITVNSNLNNSNDVVIEVYAEDNAMNGSSESIAIKIDTTAPTISVAYSNNSSIGTLYKDPRTAQISIRERNFSDKYVTILVNGEPYQISGGWKSTAGTGNGDNTLWYAEVPFTADGDYTFGITCSDLAANKSGDVDYGDSTHPTQFTIDGTSPVINVEFIEGDNPHESNYYQNPRTAQITIDELHFDKSAANDGVKCSVVVDKHDSKGNSETSTTVLSDWTQMPNSNKYVATMKFESDAQYTFNVSYTDQAGNVGQAYSTAFFIDKVNPSLTVSANGSEKRGAYSDKIESLISFEDTNFDSSNVEITMTGVNVEVTNGKMNGDDFTFTLKNKSGDTIEWTGHFVDITEEGNSKIYGKKLSFDNFPEGAELKEFDDIYTVTVSLVDKSGRKTSKTLTFSVNRFGSTYDISKVKDVLGTYSQNPPTIIVSEVNPDELTEYTITLFKNNETITLNKGTDYDVEVIGGENEWHEYIYSIPAANFTDDGVYSITLHSVDKAKNISENTLDTKDSEIGFAVDNTPPKAMVANIESGKTYAESSRTVILTADDNIRLSHIAVYLDNDKQIYKEWSSEEISNILGKNNEEEREFSFDINGDSTKAHTLKIVCTDAAGNETELSFNGFYVTTNMWIRFINNKPALFGSIGGLVAVIGGAIFFITRRKKRT